MKIPTTIKRFILSVGCVFNCFAILTKGNCGGLPAFPGAEGFGSTTAGGRGGKIIEVTNTQDSGPGSLRAAVEAEGPRTVIFRVGGIIELEQNIRISSPFITIAGQTAPGNGICLKNGGFWVRTHDVIIRGIYARPGDSEIGEDPGTRRGIWITSTGAPTDVYNIIVDHCSFSWAVDKNINIFGKLGSQIVREITFQWCIIAEGLAVPRAGMTISSKCNDISIHHCLFLKNFRENPNVDTESRVELINNFVYNWESTAFEVSNSGGTVNTVDAVNNIFKPGPRTKLCGNKDDRRGIVMRTRDRNFQLGTQVYVSGNIGPGRLTGLEDEWETVQHAYTECIPPPTVFQSLEPVVNSGTVTIDPLTNPDAFQDFLLDNVGVVVLDNLGDRRRDAVDSRLINEVQHSLGDFTVDSPADVGGYPIYPAGNPPVDDDRDGMPDAWEIAHDLNPDNPDDHRDDRNGDGYTNIEEYINGLIPVPGPLTSDLNVTISANPKTGDAPLKVNFGSLLDNVPKLPVFDAKSGVVTIEAENFHSTTNIEKAEAVIKTEIGGFLGSGYIESPSIEEVSFGYNVKVEEESLNKPFFLWIRRHVLADGDGSISFEWNGATFQEDFNTIGEAAADWDWQYQLLPPATEAGLNTIHIHYHQGGYRIDRMVLQHSEMQPSDDTLESDQSEISNLSFAWDFGDNETSSEANPTHLYKFPGTFTATLRVDADEVRAVDSQIVVVSPADCDSELDSISPVVIPPAEGVMACDDSEDPHINPLLGFASALDNCDSNLSQPTFHDDTTESCPGLIIRTWSVEDASGNVGTAQQLIRKKQDVEITFEEPEDGADILFGQNVPVRAFVQSQNRTALTVLARVRFVNEARNQVIEQFRSAQNGLLEIPLGFTPIATGMWRVEIQTGENDQYFQGNAVRLVTVRRSKSGLELFHLGAPHFPGQDLAVIGELSLLNLNLGGVSLKDYMIDFKIRNPDGTTVATSNPSLSAITDKNGEFSLSISTNNIFNMEGDWTLQAVHDGDNNIVEASSSVYTIPVRNKRGYAILVRGSVRSGEGIAEHQKTIDFVKSTLRADGQGVLKDDLLEISADLADAKIRLRDSIEIWAEERIRDSAAPLFLVLVGHGEPNAFHLTSPGISEDDILLEPKELDQWLLNLDDKLQQNSIIRKDPIVVVPGMCFGGSFIDELSGPNRVIISASAKNERSIRGPGDPDQRQGEYFVYLLYRELSKGKNLFDSFLTSRDIIRSISSEFDLATNRESSQFFSQLGQHPLLDDDDDGVGTHAISQSTNDGKLAKTIVLKVPDNSIIPVSIHRTNPTIFLGNPQEIPHLWAEVNERPEDEKVHTLFFEVKRPDAFELEGSESMQANLELIRQEMDPIEAGANKVRFQWPGNGADTTLFNQPGKYEIYFYAINGTDSSISSPAVTYVFRQPQDVELPSAFELLTPLPKAQVDFVSDDKLGVFSWEPSRSEASNIHYIFRLWNNVEKTSLAFESPLLTTPFYVLKPQAIAAETYWWDVVAIDDQGNIRHSSETYEVTLIVTSPGESSPGYITGRAFDRDTGNLVPDLDIIVDKKDQNRILHFPSGEFLVIELGSSNPLTLVFQSPVYSESTISDLVIQSFDSIHLNIPMTRQRMELFSGWNLISYPVISDDRAVIRQVLSDGNWEWREGFYRFTVEIVPGFGCWVKRDNPVNITFDGQIPDDFDQIYSKGWNLIGVKGHKPIEWLEENEAIGLIWGWDAKDQAYYPINGESIPQGERYLLIPGRGYWVYLSTRRKIKMGRN